MIIGELIWQKEICIILNVISVQVQEPFRIQQSGWKERQRSVQDAKDMVLPQQYFKCCDNNL